MDEEAAMATQFDRFSPAARRVMALAQDEARALGHAYLGTEHLLLALAGEADTVTAAVLTSLAVDPMALRTAVERMVGRGTGYACGAVCVTARLKHALEQARKAAKQAKAAWVEPEHLLLGLTIKDGSVASGLLHDFGVTPSRIQAVLPTARMTAGRQLLPPARGTRRYTLVLPEELFGQVEQLAATEHTTVVELLRRFTKLGLLAAEVQKQPDAALLIRDRVGERQILLL
jgi:ATP-dependent Clp protease ATP-binding subunit ClpA